MLDDMIRLAETFSGGIHFVRVDLYQTAHGIRFGEMTSSSGNGLNRFTPVEFDRALGAYWKVRRRPRANLGPIRQRMYEQVFDPNIRKIAR